MATDVDVDTSVTIDITGLYSDSVHKNVDDFVAAMKIVCLETNDSSVVSDVDEVVASSSHIYVRDYYQGGSVAIFDIKGKFLRRLPKGQAPFEIGRAGSIFFDKTTGFFYVYDKMCDKILKYSGDGMFLSSHYCGEFPMGIAVKGEKLFMAEMVVRDGTVYFDVVVSDTAVAKKERLTFGKLNVNKESLNRFFYTYYDGITINNPWNYNIVNYTNEKWEKIVLNDSKLSLNLADVINSSDLRSQINEDQMIFKGVCYHSNGWWLCRFIGKSFPSRMFYNIKTGDKWFVEPSPHSFYNLIDLYGVQDSDEQNILGIIDPEYMIQGSQASDFVWDGSNMNGLLSDEDMSKLKAVKPDDNPIIVLFKLKDDI